MQKPAWLLRLAAYSADPSSNSLSPLVGDIFTKEAKPTMRLRVMRRSTIGRVAGMTLLTAELCLKHFSIVKRTHQVHALCTSHAQWGQKEGPQKRPQAPFGPGMTRQKTPRILLEGIGGPTRAESRS